MSASVYRKGVRLEAKTRAWLERQGYSVTRAAGSHGLWDLIGFSAQDVRLCQSRANRWCSSAELAAMQAFPVPPFVRKQIVRWDDYCRTPRVREVIDRAVLAELERRDGHQEIES